MNVEAVSDIMFNGGLRVEKKILLIFDFSYDCIIFARKQYHFCERKDREDVGLLD